MKKLLMVPAVLAALMMGTGTANATSTLPPCPEEDSINCVWNAQEQGNGQGRSFTNIDGVVTYWDEPVADLPSDPTAPEGEAIDGPTVYPLEPEPTGTHDPCDRASFCPDGPPAEVPVEVYPEPLTEPVESYPAPPVEPVAEPVPAPVEVQQVAAPEPIPVGTEERVAAGEELAYTGVGDAVLAGLAASVLSGGVVMIWLARRMRTA